MFLSVHFYHTNILHKILIILFLIITYIFFCKYWSFEVIIFIVKYIIEISQQTYTNLDF